MIEHALKRMTECALLSVSIISSEGWCQPYPAKPIFITVGLQAATGSDIAVRSIAERMAAPLGQQIVIENLPGASGVLAAVKIAKAPADGYSLAALSNAAMTILPNLEKVPYDPFKDLVPVAFVSGDRLAVTQLQQVAPAAEGAIVKEPYGYHSALTVTPARGQAMIRDGLKRAMAKLGSLQPYRLTAPIALEVGFKLTLDAERAAFVPGLTRSDAHNVKGTFRDMTDITKLLQVLTSFELP